MTLLAAYAFDTVGGATVTDLSGNGYDITLTGSDGAQVSGGALGKTGATMPTLPTGLIAASETDDRTIMLDVLGTGRAVWWIRWNDDVLGSGIWGALALDGNTLQSRARRQSDSAAAGTLTFGALDAGTWHNACLTYKRSTGVLSVYWDGSVVSSGIPSGWSAGQQLMVGADRIDLAEWTATGPAIDNLRIFSHTLTDPEVAALAGTPVTAPARTGSASLAATAGLATSGRKTAAGTVTLAAGAALAASGRKTSAGTAPLAAAATITAAGARSTAGSASLAAAAQLAAVGTRSARATVPLAGSAAISTAGQSHRSGSVTLRATVSLAAGQAASAHDTTLTAALAAQTTAAVVLGAQRWTATLGTQP